jgi:hypothetical protein
MVTYSYHNLDPEKFMKSIKWRTCDPFFKWIGAHMAYFFAAFLVSVKVQEV